MISRSPYVYRFVFQPFEPIFTRQSSLAVTVVSFWHGVLVIRVCVFVFVVILLMVTQWSGYDYALHSMSIDHRCSRRDMFTLIENIISFLMIWVSSLCAWRLRNTVSPSISIVSAETPDFVDLHKPFQKTGITREIEC